jgi:hypothetical protein
MMVREWQAEGLGSEEGWLVQATAVNEVNAERDRPTPRVRSGVVNQLVIGSHWSPIGGGGGGGIRGGSRLCCVGECAAGRGRRARTSETRRFNYCGFTCIIVVYDVLGVLWQICQTE